MGPGIISRHGLVQGRTVEVGRGADVNGLGKAVCDAVFHGQRASNRDNNGVTLHINRNDKRRLLDPEHGMGPMQDEEGLDSHSTFDVTRCTPDADSSHEHTGHAGR